MTVSAMLLEVVSKISSNIIQLVERIRVVNSWENGLVTGSAGVGVVGLMWASYPLWNSKLSIFINIMNVIDLRLGLGTSTLSRLRITDVESIKFCRRLQDMLPLGPLRKIHSSRKMNIVSAKGHLIPIIVHTPVDHTEGSPLIVYIHGGGFVVGSAKFYDNVCTCIAKETQCVTVAIEYRKAPEHKFPAAPEDCIEVILWLSTNATVFHSDPSRVCVVGDSAGGNLTAIVARELYDKVSLSIPIYPVVFHGILSQSCHDWALAPILSAATMNWFSLCYFDHRDQIQHPLADPLFGHIEKLPRTHVITAEYDVLRDEGLEYADRLREAGVAVSYRQYDNTHHGFFGMVRDRS